MLSAGTHIIVPGRLGEGEGVGGGDQRVGVGGEGNICNNVNKKDKLKK